MDTIARVRPKLTLAAKADPVAPPCAPAAQPIMPADQVAAINRRAESCAVSIEKFWTSGRFGINRRSTDTRRSRPPRPKLCA